MELPCFAPTTFREGPDLRVATRFAGIPRVSCLRAKAYTAPTPKA